jgi:hypothetical protein
LNDPPDSAVVSAEAATTWRFAYGMAITSNGCGAAAACSPRGRFQNTSPSASLRTKRV